MSALEQQLIGAWRLVSLERRRSDGTTSQPLGPQPIGLFVFGPDHHYSVQLMDPSRSGDDAAGADGYAAGADGYVASWGTYRVGDTDDHFVLTLIGSLAVASVGTSTTRRVRIHDRIAVFNTDPEVVDGTTVQSFITWEKVAS